MKPTKTLSNTLGNSHKIIKCYLIAGEKSGDQHGAALMKALKKEDSSCEFRGIGGEAMLDQGLSLYKHYSDTAIMGFLEVIKKLKAFRQRIKATQEDILSYAPDVLICIDFGGFNLRIAEYCKKRDIQVHYFIPPKVWAWGTWRVKKIKRSVHALYCILPFEASFFEERGVPAHYVGNPSVEQVLNHTWDRDLLQQIRSGSRPRVALLPGSRQQEIQGMAPALIEVIKKRKDWDFYVAGLQEVPHFLYDGFTQHEHVKLYYKANFEVLKGADVAIVNSGTATLECALIGTPQVVGYKTSWFNFFLARRLIRVRFISLVNLIAGYEVIHEQIQGNYTAEVLERELEQLLDEKKRQLVLKGYALIKKRLGKESASKQTAQLILQDFKL